MGSVTLSAPADATGITSGGIAAQVATIAVSMLIVLLVIVRNPKSIRSLRLDRRSEMRSA
jgi:hypothetical protein